METAAVLLLTATLSLTFLLLFFGLIGPSELRQRMRKLNKWLSHDSELFFPLDPYRSISQAVREGIKHFWPTRQRVMNFIFLVGMMIGLFIAVFVVSIIVIAVLSGH